MRTLLLLLLLPLTTLGQSVDSWDVVRNGYYKVVVDGDTLADNFTRYDTALKFAYDQATGGEIKIIPPSYDFNYTLKEYDTTNVEDITLQNVNYSYQVIDGQPSLSYEAETRADSLVFHYYDGSIPLRKAYYYPKGGVVRDTLKDPPDTVNVHIEAYWQRWVENYREIVDITFLSSLGQTMALQDIPYLTATWTNPASNLTDYVGYFDLSDAPQSWWDEVNTSDGTKLRVAKDDAAEGATTATELAFDIQNFDDVAQTGELWFKWSGTLSTTPNDVRIYPAKSSATSYAVTDMFGRNNVWTNAVSVLHGNSFEDATGNNTVSQSNTSFVAGKIGDSFSIIQDSSRVDVVLDSVLTPPFTMAVWGNPDDLDNHTLVSVADKDVSDQQHRLLGDNDVSYNVFDGTVSYTSGLDMLNTNQWYMWHGVAVSDSERTLYKGDGSANATNTNTVNVSGIDRLTVGTTADSSPFGWWNGELDEVRVWNYAVGTDEIAHTHANQNNVGTFWSSITLDNTGGGATITMDKGTFSLTGYDLYQNLSTPLNDGSFTLSGYPLLQNLSIPLDNGSLTSNGYALSFGLSVPVNSGSFSLTGYDVVYNRSVPIDQGSISQSGYALNLNLSVPLTNDSFSVTGYELNFDEQNVIIMGSGSFSVDGNELSFQFTHPLDNGSYAVSGNSIHFNTSIPLQGATFNLDGKTLSFKQVLQLDNGQFDVTGYPLLFDAVENIVILSGNSLITDITGTSTIADVDGKSLITDIEGESTL